MFDKLRNQTQIIDKKLYLVFIALIFIAIINAVVSTFNIEKSKNISNEISNVTQPTVSGLFEMEHIVTRSRMYITNWVYMPNNKSDKENIFKLNTIEYPQLKVRLQNLSQSWKDIGSKTALKEIFIKYDKIIGYEQEIMNSLVSFDDYQEPIKKFAAEEILETQIIPASLSLTSELAQIYEIKNTEANSRHDDMHQAFSIMKSVLLSLALLICIAVITMTFYMSKNFIGPLMRIRKVLLQMSRGELPALTMKAPQNAVGEMISGLKSLMQGLRQTTHFAEEIGRGNFDSPFQPLSENDVQGKSLLDMRQKLKSSSDQEQQRKWIADGLEKISAVSRIQFNTTDEIANRFMSEIAGRIAAGQGAVFCINKNLPVPRIELCGGYGLSSELLHKKSFLLNEGLLGQCISENKKINFTSMGDALFGIQSALHQASQTNVYLFPLNSGGDVIGAIEIGTVAPLENMQIEYIENACEQIAASLSNMMANMLTKKLLEASLKQADELAAQKQELRWANDEMQKKSKQLEVSQQELKVQQDELKQVNAELEIKAHLLEERNMALEEAQQSLAFKAEQLEQSSKYKSAFLANMSHELRTPLNSILILAKLLTDNKAANLTQKQVEHSRVIHKSGSDLLMLINDILDLSKIESGKLEFVLENVPVANISDDMKMLFAEFANEKQIRFDAQAEHGTFDTIITDKLRLEQVIKNLLSNAFKFTAKDGAVSLRFFKATDKSVFQNEILKDSDEVIGISVTDTGIGIPPEKQKIIFDAFQQADGSTSRRYGGTGLGLAISREITHLLGGDLTCTSTEGKGSTFTILVPRQTEQKKHEPKSIEQNAENAVQANRHAKNLDDKINHSTKYNDTDFSDDRQFINEKDKVVLIIEDDVLFLKLLIDYCHIYGYKAIATQQGETGLLYAAHHNPCAIILDMMLPDTDGSILLSKLKSNQKLQNIPVHIVTALDKKPVGLKKGGAASFIKKPVDKPQLEKLFMNLEQYNPGSENDTPQEKQNLSLTDGHSLKGKTILMADDDMRNIYALSTMFEEEGVNLICAYNGREAIDKLEQNPNVDIVLMDIMMPVMDGYEAMETIRQNDKFKNIPMLAVTAKALEGEREKCKQSGATDYISKPVNNELLISKIKFWLYQ